jgi:hypothetical protein
MKRLLRTIENFGISPLAFIRSIKALPWFYKTKRAFKKLDTKKDFPITRNYMCLHDKNDKSGTLSGQYFNMDLLIARRVFENNPTKHIDIGSNIQGFVAHVASFRQIEIFDIRPNESKIKNIVFKQADFSNPVVIPDAYTDSLSCLHAIEHFGLGRYGDPIDPDGHLKGLDNMYKMLQKEGTFYFATPIGSQRIEFNAHRVFSVKYLLEQFEPRYIVKHFSYVDDQGELFENVELTKEMIDTNCCCNYGCGIFEMIKK